MNQFMPPRGRRFSGGALAAARVAMGLLWLTNLSWKLPPTFDCEPGEGNGLCYWMGQMVAHSQIDAHARFIEDVVLPNYTVFGYLVVGAEALTGLLLVFGLFTRFGALLGLAQSINLYIGLAKAPDEWIWTYAMMALLHLVILALAAGRFFGADAILHDRFARTARRKEIVARAGALAT